MAQLMIRPIGNNCNLCCKYCNTRRLNDSEMPKELLKKSIDKSFKLFKDYNHNDVSIVFHGGEPLLASDNFYYNLEQYLSTYSNEFNITRKIQTNLYSISARKIKLFKLLKYRVSVSLDGPKESNNLRLNQKKKPIFQSIIKNICLLKRNKIPVNILVTVGKHNHKQFKKILNFFEREQLSFSINFLNNSKYDLSEQEKLVFISNISLHYKKKKKYTNNFLAAVSNKTLSRCAFYDTCLNNFSTIVIDFNGIGYLCNRFLNSRTMHEYPLFNVNKRTSLEYQIKNSKLFICFRKLKKANNCFNCSILPFFCGGLDCPYELIAKNKKPNTICTVKPD